MSEGRSRESRRSGREVRQLYPPEDRLHVALREVRKERARAEHRRAAEHEAAGAAAAQTLLLDAMMLRRDLERTMALRESGASDGAAAQASAQLRAKAIKLLEC